VVFEEVSGSKIFHMRILIEEESSLVSKTSRRFDEDIDYSLGKTFPQQD
jgi:hypothetical protein